MQKIKKFLSTGQSAQFSAQIKMKDKLFTNCSQL